jgi:recombinational DNA repair protein (RecF pathway)
VSYQPDPRRCSDCGIRDPLVLVRTVCGDALCRRCWCETTQVTAAPPPPAPPIESPVAPEARKAAQ